MTKLIPTLAFALAAITLAPPASADDPLTLQPCERPGPVGVLYETDYYTVPYYGYSWSGSKLRLNGESHNATVWKTNYDVAGRCVAGASVTVGNGPSSPCPPAGQAGTLATTGNVFIVEDTYWGPDGHLYARGYDQSYSAVGYNNRVGGACAGTAQTVSATPKPREVCLTCASNDDVETLP